MFACKPVWLQMLLFVDSQACMAFMFACKLSCIYGFVAFGSAQATNDKTFLLQTLRATCRMDRMERPGRRMAPQPLHRLSLLLLCEGLEERTWRSDILVLSLPGILGATRSSSHVLLALGPDEFRFLMRANRAIYRIFQVWTEEVISRRTELQRQLAEQ